MTTIQPSSTFLLTGVKVVRIGMLIIAATVVGLVSTSCGNDAHGQDTAHVSLPPSNFSNWKLPAKLSFCGEEVPLDIPEVRERAEREFYVNLQTPGQIILYIKRAGRYFAMYEKLLKEAKAPDDLKYLSVAESALYMARSPKDAVGLWQFIPATARQMGLVVTDDIDERRNAARSTRAAIAYLQEGYDLNGSWTSAAAGYNMGHVTYGGSMSYQRGTSFYDLFLNEETSRYVLRISVIKYLMENAHQFGIIVPKSETYADPEVKTVTVRNPVSDLSSWASSEGTTYKDVKLLNPWILGRTIPAPPTGRSWEVRIPKK